MRLGLIFTGCIVYSFGVNLFIIPHNLLSGGVTGIALLIHYIAGYSVGIMVFILNIPIFLFGLKKVNKEFVALSIFGTLSISLSLVFTRPIHIFAIDDILLSCIYGGVIMGIGVGIVFRQGGSTGGTDIISVFLKKEKGINISTVLFSSNLAVVTLGAIASNKIQVALYTLTSMYITSTVIDRVIEGFQRKKMLFIITRKEKEVSSAIMNEIGRGVTYVNGEGAYTGESKRILYCVISTNQLVKAKRIVETADSRAFMTIADIAEVQGKGFKTPRV